MCRVSADIGVNGWLRTVLLGTGSAARDQGEGAARVLAEAERGGLAQVGGGVDVAAQARPLPEERAGARPFVPARRTRPEQRVEGHPGGGEQEGRAGALCVDDEGPPRAGREQTESGLDRFAELVGAQGGEIGLQRADDRGGV